MHKRIAWPDPKVSERWERCEALREKCRWLDGHREDIGGTSGRYHAEVISLSPSCAGKFSVRWPFRFLRLYIFYARICLDSALLNVFRGHYLSSFRVTGWNFVEIVICI